MIVSHCLSGSKHDV